MRRVQFALVLIMVVAAFVVISSFFPSPDSLEVNTGRDEVNLANEDYRINRMTVLNVEQQKVVSLWAIHDLFDATAYQRAVIIDTQTVGTSGARDATAGVVVLLSALTILIILFAVYAVFRLHKALSWHNDF